MEHSLHTDRLELAFYFSLHLFVYWRCKQMSTGIRGKESKAYAQSIIKMQCHIISFDSVTFIPNGFLFHSIVHFALVYRKTNDYSCDSKRRIYFIIHSNETHTNATFVAHPSHRHTKHRKRATDRPRRTIPYEHLVHTRLLCAGIECSIYDPSVFYFSSALLCTAAIQSTSIVRQN